MTMCVCVRDCVPAATIVSVGPGVRCVPGWVSVSLHVTRCARSVSEQVPVSTSCLLSLCVLFSVQVRCAPVCVIFVNWWQEESVA